MSYYTHRKQRDAGQYVHVGVTLHYSGDLVPSYTHHMNDPHHIRVDVHSENSVKKRKIKFL
jgi:hypothetical protein